jgi:Effector-associated domain 7
LLIPRAPTHTHLRSRNGGDEQFLSPLSEPFLDKDKLVEALRTRFDEDELLDPMFKLDEDYEGIRGETRNAKARELVLKFMRRSQLDMLPSTSHVAESWRAAEAASAGCCCSNSMKFSPPGRCISLGGRFGKDW